MGRRIGEAMIRLCYRTGDGLFMHQGAVLLRLRQRNYDDDFRTCWDEMKGYCRQGAPGETDEQMLKFESLRHALCVVSQ